MSTRRDAIPEDGRPPRARRATRLVLLLAAVLAAGVCWAGVKGFIPPVWQGGWGCSDVGYPDPPPTFDELVEVHRESPYCARRVRDEAWF